MTLVAILALSGCGGGESSETAVRKAVEGFDGAIAKGDLASACEEIDPQLEAFVKSGGGSCAAGLKKDLSSDSVDLGSLKIAKISVSGRSAVVTFKGDSGTSFELAQSATGNHWQISDFQA